MPMAAASASERAQQLCWWERQVCGIVGVGTIPPHIAFIMDGNRRFARDRGLEVAHGHRLGYEKLEQVLRWCGTLGIKAVTVYAFSLDNFRRSPDEVLAIMRLCGEKLRGMCHHDSLIRRHGIRVRVVGDLGRLSADLQEDILRVEATTAHNARAILTVCLAYTSRHEIAQAVRRLASRYARERGVGSETRWGGGGGVQLPCGASPLGALVTAAFSHLIPYLTPCLTPCLTPYLILRVCVTAPLPVLTPSFQFSPHFLHLSERMSFHLSPQVRRGLTIAACD